VEGNRTSEAGAYGGVPAVRLFFFPQRHKPAVPRWASSLHSTNSLEFFAQLNAGAGISPWRVTATIWTRIEAASVGRRTSSRITDFRTT
jgi:hypothetical protein